MLELKSRYERDTMIDEVPETVTDGMKISIYACSGGTSKSK